ncbi:Tetratricopeptide repeat protein [Planctomycetes bacterium Pan216]|uniref:Tetratricopeptide repeat protein n=1 Tax=Kolteria novifilia TaxID=2527975 RepID=A0A518BCW7_9BACT|nr:Tetratricopeptide repeat protein [Planctomycetes bacterium Pan216]
MPLSTRALINLEYQQKGAFLGLAVLVVAGVQTISESAMLLVASVVLMLATMVGLSWWSRRKAPDVPKSMQQNMLASLVLAILEHPGSIYVAVLAVMLVAVLFLGWPLWAPLVAVVVGGLFGWGLHLFLRLDPKTRRWTAIGFVVVVAAAAGFLAYLGGEMLAERFETSIAGGVATLVVVLLFSLMVLAGRGEESELEIGILALGLALALANLQLPIAAQRLVLLVPLALFVIYCERARKSFIVLKQVIRGLHDEQSGQLGQALIWYRRALAIDPKSEMARNGSWRVHRGIDLRNVTENQELLEMVDPVECLDRARSLLDRRDPSGEELEEAGQLLDIVAHRRDDVPLTIGYERLRVLLAQRRGDEALRVATQLVVRRPSATFEIPNHEAEALFLVWAELTKHPLLAGPGGLALLDSGQHLLAFLASVERRLEQRPDDADAASFKAFLYPKVTLELYEKFLHASPGESLDWFDFRAMRDLGRRRLEEENDLAGAADATRVAETGLTQERLSLWKRLAEIEERRGSDEAWRWRERIRDFGREVGVSRLSTVEQSAFYDAVRQLAERAHAAGEIEAAIEHYELYADAPTSGQRTLRLLKSLHEERGDRLAAIRPVELALAYQLSDAEKKEWLAEKHRLYRDITPPEVQSRLVAVERFFDFWYCFREAKRLLEQDADLELVKHYLELAALGGSRLVPQVNYLLGRINYRQEAYTDAAACLEQVVQARPERFASSEDEEIYFSSCRLLGDLYLDRLDDPDRAVECYLIYKDYLKSGAETLFRLGCAYERSGRPKNARKWYDMVLVYPGHPRASDAKEALARLST